MITVTLGENADGGGNTGSGSQGRSVGAPATGEEVQLDSETWPGGSSGGANQQQFGDDCITVELTPGTAELKSD